ncbi:hypothetical protein C4G66_RS23635 [Vibrio parahaemolyticus]|nr:hypothetical protein [Vibrio parahaemolyticus]EJG1071843.1 hypothetical protein [Vibrio parahaemolyticus]HCG9740888.1 hypothetical protein [Vibrio parahaemolyticus]
MVGFSFSETDLFVESQLGDIVCLKELFGVVGLFLRRFEFQVVSVTVAFKLRLILVFQNT